MKRLPWILAWFCGLWPEVWVAAFSQLGGGLWWHVLRYRRGIITDNLAQAFPEKSEAQRAQLGRQACTHLLQTLLEVFRLPRYLKQGLPTVIRVEGMEHVEAALADGKAKGHGVLSVCGHIGSWELGVAAVAQAMGPERPVSVVVKRFTPGFEAYMTSVRNQAGLKVVSAPGAVRPIMKSLRAGETVGFILDQNATRNIGVFVDFFGRPACTMAGLAVFAQRTEAVVLPAIPEREGPGRHVVRILPPVPWQAKETREETVLHMTQVYTKLIEDQIRAVPAQWFWTHKRWRTRPLNTNTPAAEAEDGG